MKAKTKPPPKRGELYSVSVDLVVLRFLVLLGFGASTGFAFSTSGSDESLTINLFVTELGIFYSQTSAGTA